MSTADIKVPVAPPPDVSKDTSSEGMSLFGSPTPSSIMDDSNTTMGVEPGMAQQVADIYNVAHPNPVADVSVADVLHTYTNLDMGQSAPSIAAAHTAINNENGQIDKNLAISALSDSSTPVDQRIKLARDFGVPKFDANVITRQAMHNVNLVENGGYTPEAKDDFEKGAKVAEALPRHVVVDTPVPASTKDIQSTYINQLNQVWKDANDNTGITDYFGQMVPGYSALKLEVPVMKIYHALGLDQGAVNKSGYLLMGNALDAIRQHVEGQDAAGKLKSLDTIMSILKPNSGVFTDGNNLVISHTLEQVFYNDLHPGQQYGDQSSPTSMGNLLANLMPTQGAQQAVKGYLKDKQITGSQIVDNFTSLLDATGVGSIIKGTIKLGTKWLPSSIRRMMEVAPDMATKSMADALRDPAVLARFPGMKPEDIVAASLPASAKAMQEGGVNGLGELTIRQLDIRDSMLRIAENTNLTQAERADAFAEVQKQFGEIAAAPDSTLHLNESIFTPKDNGIDIEAMFGRTHTKPFSSYAQAAWSRRDAIEKVFGTDANVDIVWRNPETKVIEPVPQDIGPFEKGDFFMRATDNRAYEASPTEFHKLVFGDQDVANLQYAPSLWKAIRGPVNLLGADAANNIRLAPRLRARWNQLSVDLMSDVGKLGKSDMNKLSSVLKQGETEGKIFAPSELEEMGMSQAGQRAYYASRNAMDIMFEAANRAKRTRMFQDGMVDVHGPTGRVGFAQPRSLLSAAGDMEGRLSLAAFDPVDGTYKALSHTDLESLYNAGNSVARLETPLLGKGGNEATHVIMDESRGVKALGLPRQVLTKVEGYVPHMWNGNYVVHATTNSGLKVALGLAKNEQDAKTAAGRFTAAINNMKKAGQTPRFAQAGYDFDRSLTTDLAHRAKTMEDIYVNMGGPVFGARNGGDLRNFSRAAGDIQVDPIEAMMRGMEIVGTTVTKQDLASYMRQKLYNYARQEGILSDPTQRTIPMVKEDLKLSADKSTAYNKAKAYMDSIDFMLNTRDSVDSAVSKFFLGASKAMSSMMPTSALGKAISGKLASAAARGGDPMSALMGITTRRVISASPISQAALQASQSLIMLGVSPTNYAKAVAQTAAIAQLIGLRSLSERTGVGVINNAWEKEAAGLAKWCGMDEQEMIKVVKTIMDNGLISAVSYHSQMRNAMRSAAMERMMADASSLNKPILGPVGRFVRNIDAQTFGRMNQLGFQAGEDFNQIATFLTLYNKDKSAGKAALDSMDYVKKLIGTTAELTGDMIPETSYTYNRGWFKAAMQFIQYQHKMTMLMLPQGMGGAKNITGAEKAGIALAQFLLFGRRATPHMDAMYRLIDAQVRQRSQGENDPMFQAWNDPKTRAVMDGLLFDTVGNYVLKEIFHNDKEYALSDRFAPGGSYGFMMDRLTQLVTSNPTDAIFGMSADTSSRLYDYGQRIGNVALANIRKMDDIPFDERMRELAQQGGATLFSTYNRYLASAAADRLDGFVSAGGQRNEGFAGPLEENLYTMFGVESKDRQALYDARDKFKESNTDPEEAKSNMDQLVDQYYKDFINNALIYNKEAKGDQAFYSLVDGWSRERGLLFSVLPPKEAEYVRDGVAKKIQNLVSKPQDSAERAIVDRLSKQIKDGKFGDEGPSAAAYLDEAEFVRNNPALHEIIRQTWEDANADHYMEKP